METWYAGPDYLTIAQGPGGWRRQNCCCFAHTKHDEVDDASAQEPDSQGLANVVGQLVPFFEQPVLQQDNTAHPTACCRVCCIVL
jgi:hypothetical protein